MALSILDGNQSATTLSTILSSGQHITAHTVVSLGTQAITDIVNATSTGLTNTQLRASAVTIAGSVFVSQPPISTARLGVNLVDSSGTGNYGTDGSPLNISGTVTANTFGEDKVNIGNFHPIPLTDSGEAVSINILQAFGSAVNVPISGTVTASILNSVTIGSLPLISGAVTANTFAIQGTAVTTSSFTSIASSTVLANYSATRKVLTIFNEGAGNLHICAGATCTTIAYQVRLSAGDYYEVPNHQTTVTHSAVFATAGTARVTEIT